MYPLFASAILASCIVSLIPLHQLRKHSMASDFGKFHDNRTYRDQPIHHRLFTNPMIGLSERMTKILLTKYEDHLERVIPGMDHVKNSVLFAKGEAYQRVKRLMMPFFEHENIRNMTDELERITLLKTDEWDAAIGKDETGRAIRHFPHDVEDLIAGIISEVVFGADLKDYLKWLTHEQMDVVNMKINGFRIPDWKKKNLKESGKRFTEGLVVGRSSRTKSFTPLIQYLAEAEDSEISMEELIQNSMMLMFAAQETTRAVLQSAIYNVSGFNDSAALDLKLQLENDTSANWFLKRFTNDMIYKFSPVPVIQRKVIKDIVIDGYCLPAGTMLSLPTVGPFSTGQRSCMGQRLARKELEVIFKIIFTKYRFKRLDFPSPQGPDLYAKFIRAKGSDQPVIQITHF